MDIEIRPSLVVRLSLEFGSGLLYPPVDGRSIDIDEGLVIGLLERQHVGDRFDFVGYWWLAVLIALGIVFPDTNVLSCRPLNEIVRSDLNNLGPTKADTPT